MFTSEYNTMTIATCKILLFTARKFIGGKLYATYRLSPGGWDWFKNVFKLSLRKTLTELNEPIEQSSLNEYVA